MFGIPDNRIVQWRAHKENYTYGEEYTRDRVHTLGRRIAGIVNLVHTYSTAQPARKIYLAAYNPYTKMRPAQCLGRLVKDGPKGVHMLEFEEGGLFHLPIRCDTIAKNGDLCDSCYAKQKKTEEKVREITGTTIKGMLPSYLMGRVTEPIPFWSRLYDGAWYRLKIQSGCTLSEKTMARAKKAAATAYDGVQTVEPEAMPAGARKTKGRPKKAETPVEAPVVTPVETTIVTAPVKKRQPKKVEPVAPVAILPNPTEEIPVETIKEIKVRKREIDGRSLYVGQKDKVYDLKFKYLGRLKDETIIAFPDSDEGM